MTGYGHYSVLIIPKGFDIPCLTEPPKRKPETAPTAANGQSLRQASRTPSPKASNKKAKKHASTKSSKKKNARCQRVSAAEHQVYVCVVKHV